MVPLVLARDVGYRDTVLKHPLQLAAIPTRLPGPAVASLDGQHTRIIAALDALIAQGR